MANILYGVNGEGSGHSSRAREVLVHLLAHGHTVHVASFDRGLKNLAGDFDVTEIFGLRLVYEQNRVRYGKTIYKNVAGVPRALMSARILRRLAERWSIGLVITDFEPLSCHVGHALRLPIISIDNQHCLVNCEISYPRRYRKAAAAAKLVSRLMTPHADAYLVVSFFRPHIKRKRTFLFPPILCQDVLQSHPVPGEAVVVYETSPSDALVRSLKQVNRPFVCFGFGREGQDGNLLFRKPSRTGFLKDLAAANAVIANSGFSLISEALFLGKPYLAWPVKGQFEQVFNAHYIREMGYGDYWDDLSAEKIGRFLSRLDQYRRNLASYPRQDNSALFAKLDELIVQLVGLPR
jgi:uncharacterized protein (TIGR00661 family)